MCCMSAEEAEPFGSVVVQAIYGFIGAEDHLRRVAGARVRHLTQVRKLVESVAGHRKNTLTLRWVFGARSYQCLSCGGCSVVDVDVLVWCDSVLRFVPRKQARYGHNV